jgi:hypothetical protein
VRGLENRRRHIQWEEVCGCSKNQSERCIWWAGARGLKRQDDDFMGGRRRGAVRGRTLTITKAMEGVRWGLKRLGEHSMGGRRRGAEIKMLC